MILHQERSGDGNPSVSITFPDGFQDNLVLNKLGQCNWAGHLQNEQDACVAMTGCPGQDDLDLTILSEHLRESNLLRWYKNGDVEYIETLKPETLTEIPEDMEPIINDQVRSDDNVKMQSTHLMNVRVVYDKHVLDDAGSEAEADKQIHTVMTHVQASFCHRKTLGTKIQLKYEIKYAKDEYWLLGGKDENDVGPRSNDFIKNNPDFFKGSDMNVIICNPGGGGVACFGCMCHGPGKAINSWHQNPIKV